MDYYYKVYEKLKLNVVGLFFIRNVLLKSFVEYLVGSIKHYSN
jgi:hypothetical protein